MNPHPPGGADGASGTAGTTAILFDFGGTLDADGVHWPLRFFAAYRTAGGHLSREEFEPLFQATDRAMAALPDIRRLGLRDAVAAQAGLLVAGIANGEPVSASSIAAELHGSAVTVVERNRPMLERLARRHALGVVSNFWGNLEPVLDELRLRHLFRAVSDSAVLGIDKPAPGIFLRTLEAIGVQPGDAWMVGDNPEADIRPARALGLRTCWLAPPERPTPDGLAPTARIARLTELEPLVG